MRKDREAVLIAALAGLLIVSVAAFIVQPSLAGAKPVSPRVQASAVTGGVFQPSTSSIA
jgi:hypothetical protein